MSADPSDAQSLLSINVGRPRSVLYKGRRIETGIYKEPVEGPLMLRELGAEGDGQADLSVHGGLDKAIYAYPHEHYAYWADKLQRDDLTLGQFGENLTTVGFVEADTAVGDRFQIGEALLEVTQPRNPCMKLGIRMGLSDFPKQFIESGRSGFYLRVITEGSVTAGDTIERIHRNGDSPSLSELLAAYYQPAENVATLRRGIEVEALSQAWRNDLTERLVQVAGQSG